MQIITLKGYFVKKLIILAGIILLTACATNPSNQSGVKTSSQKQLPASDYEKLLVYPEKIYAMEFMSKHQFDDPLYGIQLRYAHTFSRDDILDVYVYPIPSTNWSDKLAVLKAATDAVLNEISYAVEQKHYQSAKPGEVQPIQLAGKKGMKTPLDLVFDSGARYKSFVYLFIQEDKFIKLRFSLLLGNGEGLPSEDLLAEELLTNISVPPESAYMHDKRASFIAQQMLRQIMEQMQTSEEEAGKK